MKINKKLLHIGISIMVLALLICMGFTIFITLDHPVFLRYCMEIPVSPNQEMSYNQPVFQLEYITNYNDKRKVVGISFEESPDITFIADENPPGFGGVTFFNNSITPTLGDIRGKYSLRTVYIYMINLSEKELEKDIYLKKARIQFSDNKFATVDLGNLVLFDENSDMNSLTNGYSSNSTYGNQYTSFQLKEDITLLGLESPLIELTGDILELKVNDTKYDSIDGMKCKAGSRVEISSLFTASTENLSNYDVYDLKPELNYIKSDGVTGSNRIYNIMHRNYFGSFTEIIKYLWKRGEL